MLTEINRSAIKVISKQPMVDWINSLDDEQQFTLDDMDSDIYLIGDILEEEDFDRHMAIHYPSIFENELEAWWTDEKDWPQDRSFSVFWEWFDVEIFEMVWDLESGKIEKL